MLQQPNFFSSPFQLNLKMMWFLKRKKKLDLHISNVWWHELAEVEKDEMVIKQEFFVFFFDEINSF